MAVIPTLKGEEGGEGEGGWKGVVGVGAKGISETKRIYVPCCKGHEF